jgi:hypothetical protein
MERMAPLIFGISGKAGSGKDTVADYLVKNHGFVKVSLADEMKRFAKRLFEFTDQQLWGPSENRNAVDHRFDLFETWDEAFDKLETVGAEWCKFLFGEDHAADALLKLYDWFDKLEMNYGPDSKNGNTLSPRLVLQTIGTEFGRAIDDKVWVRATMNIAKQVLEGPYRYTRETGCVHDALGWGQWWQNPKGIVIADVRFRNEVDGVRDEGGVTFRVKRPGTKLVQVGIAGHASEAEMDLIPDDAFDHVICSPEGLDKLYAHLADIFPVVIRSRS